MKTRQGLAIMGAAVLLGGVFAAVWAETSAANVAGLASSMVVLAVADTDADAEEPSTEQISAIQQNCASIKQTLQTLQKADSRMRTYLGTAYERVMNSFIKPLNLRLVKNDMPTGDFLDLQSDFSATQEDFRAAYTSYMRELENLIQIDCQKRPEAFYQQLVRTREAREKLHDSSASLNKMVNEHYQAVKKLAEEIDEAED